MSSDALMPPGPFPRPRVRAAVVVLATVTSLALAWAPTRSAAAQAAGAGRPKQGASSRPELYPRVGAPDADRTAAARLRAADPGLIRLKAVEFDPEKDGEPDFGAVLPEGPTLRPATAARRTTWLVQLDSAVTPALREQLAGAGAEFLGYIPNRALLVRLAPGVDPGVLGSQPHVRFAGRYQPGYKLSPALFHEIRDGSLAGTTVELDVSLFVGEDPDALARVLEAAFESVRVPYVRRDEPVRLVVGVSSGELTATVGALLRDPTVEYVGRRLPIEAYNDNAVWIGQSYDRAHGPSEAGAPDPKPYAESATVWNHGLIGTGQVVGVADSGIEHELCFFHDPDHPVVQQQVDPPGAIVVDPEHRKLIAVNYVPAGADMDIHGSYRHGTHVSGSVAGDSLGHVAGGGSAGHDHGDGMAPGAKLVFQDLGDTLLPGCGATLILDSLRDLFEQQYRAGARLSTNSWGSAGAYSAEAGEVDLTVADHEDFLIFFAAGNQDNAVEGVSHQAGCKNCVAVGATENHEPSSGRDPENMAAFSRRGTPDGRYKPDLVAPGLAVFSARFDVDVDPDVTGCTLDDQDMCLFDEDTCYRVDTSDGCPVYPLPGTSMASPVAAGLGALARQYFTDGFYPSGVADPAYSRNPSAALLKAVLINGARNMTGVDRRGGGPLEDAPSNVQGWGRLTLDDALYFAGDTRRLRLFDVPNAAGLVTGATATARLSVSSSGEPLKATLVWTDPPAAASANPALINDLNLVVTAPDGTVYRGNQWTADDPDVPGDRVSFPGAASSDAVNNVEAVLIRSPATGVYTLNVVGANVPGSSSMLTQGFGLVVTGAVTECTAAAPPVPTVQQVGSLFVSLQWTAVPGALGYRVYRSESACSELHAADEVFAVGAGETSYVDTDVVPDTAYTYTVRAVMAASGCETEDSACVHVTTLPAPNVVSVEPGQGVNNDPTPLTILGQNFLDGARVYLGTPQNPEKHELSPVSYVGPGELAATVPVNLLPGKYGVRVVNPDTLGDTVSGAFSVVAPIQEAVVVVADASLQPSTVKRFDRDAFVATHGLMTGTNTNNSGISIDRVNGRAVVSSFWYSKLWVFDLFDDSLERAIPLPNRVVSVAAHPAGHLVYGLAEVGPSPGKVFVVNASDGSMAGVVDLGATVTAETILVSPDGQHAYAGTFAGELWDPQPATVSVIRTSDNTQVATVPVGAGPRGMSLTADGARLYVANLYSESITVIDTGLLAAIDTLDLADPQCSEESCQRQPYGVAVSPDGTTLYVGILNQGLSRIDLITGSTLDAGLGTYSELEFHDGRLYGVRDQDLVEIDPDTLAAVPADDSAFPLDGAQAMDFLDPRPISVIAVTPNNSCTSGSVLVALTGSAFQGEVRDDGGALVQEGTRVFFGAQEATDVTLVTSGSLNARVPASSAGAGPVDVQVRNPNGRSATLVDGFTYFTCGGGGDPDPDPPKCPPNRPCHPEG